MAEILLVEEGRDTGDSIAEALTRRGHRVTRAYDGLEGLSKIYARDYDLAIVDVALSGIDGARLVKAIRKRTPGTMTLIVCARADLEGVAEALRNGAYDFIVRREVEDKLIPAVEKALREAHGMRKAGYIYKDDRSEERSLLAKRIILASMDSLLAGLAFFLSFIFSIRILGMSQSNLSIHLEDMARLSLGIAFCYAFLYVFRHSYRYERNDLGRIALGQIWRNITAAYLAFLGILFVSGNLQFLSDRAGVLLGYGLGLLSITVGRTIVIPFLIGRFRREGKKKIVIVGSAGREPQDSPFTFGRLDSMNPALPRRQDLAADRNETGRTTPAETRAIQPASPDKIEEMYIDAEKSSASEILSMIDRHRGGRLEVVPPKESSLIPEEGD